MTNTRHPFHVAAFVLLHRGDKTFILRRANTGWADGMWTVPSGHVEKGETPIEAAIKEAKEEAGVTIQAHDLKFVHVHAVDDVYINLYFTAEKWEGEPYLAEPEKYSEVAWVKLTELPEDTIVHIPKVVDAMRDGNYFSQMENDPRASRTI